MRVDTTQMLMNLRGEKPLRGLDGDVEPEVNETTVAYQKRAMVDLSFRKIAIEALLLIKENESGEIKLKKFVLAERIQLKDLVTLTNDDVKLLQDACNEQTVTVALGRMIAILDPEGYKKAKIEVKEEEETPETVAELKP